MANLLTVGTIRYDTAIPNDEFASGNAAAWVADRIRRLNPEVEVISLPERRIIIVGRWVDAVHQKKRTEIRALNGDITLEFRDWVICSTSTTERRTPGGTELGWDNGVQFLCSNKAAHAHEWNGIRRPVHMPPLKRWQRLPFAINGLAGAALVVMFATIGIVRFVAANLVIWLLVLAWPYVFFEGTLDQLLVLVPVHVASMCTFLALEKLDRSIGDWL